MSSPNQASPPNDCASERPEFPCRTLRSAANATSVATERNRLLLLLHILEELDGPLELPAIDRLRRLAGVLERDAEVRAARPRGLVFGDREVCVSNLFHTSRRVSPTSISTERHARPVPTTIARRANAITIPETDRTVEV